MKKIFVLLTILSTAFFSLGMSKPIDETKNTDAQITDKTLSKQSHQHAGTTKPHAGVEMNYQTPKALMVGDSTSLVLNFLTRSAADKLEISISADAGLQLNSETQATFATAKGEKHSLSLDISALQDGRFFVDVRAAVIDNGQAQARTFSIPVTVGDVTKLKSRSDMLSPAGYKSQPEQGVISMPAVETSE